MPPALRDQSQDRTLSVLGSHPGSVADVCGLDKFLHYPMFQFPQDGLPRSSTWVPWRRVGEGGPGCLRVACAPGRPATLGTHPPPDRHRPLQPRGSRPRGAPPQGPLGGASVPLLPRLGMCGWGTHYLVTQFL